MRYTVMLSRPILRQRSSALSNTLTDTMRFLGYDRHCFGRKSYLCTSWTPVNLPKSYLGTLWTPVNLQNILSGYLMNTRKSVKNLIWVPHEHQATCRKSYLGTAWTPVNLPKILSGYLMNTRQPVKNLIWLPHEHQLTFRKSFLGT
jgi:hypothetical protein